MATTLTTIREKVAGPATYITGRLQDGAGRLGSAGVDLAIASAVEEYSKLRPLNKAVMFLGSGSIDIPIASLTGFVDQFSVVKAVFYPYVAGQSQYPLPSSEWCLERLDTGLVLRLAYVASASSYVLTRFTAFHTLGASSTIPETDNEALADLATSYACLALADFYSQSSDGTVSADTVDHLTKASEYASRATRWRDAWRTKMGLNSEGQPAVQQTMRTVALGRA